MATEHSSGLSGRTARRPSVLRSSSMRAIVASEAVSALGTQMTFLALPWFVLTTTGSATLMGLVFAVELLPIALLGIPSGLLVKRLGVRRTMLTFDAVRALLMLMVPTLHLVGWLSFPVLLAVVFVIGACAAPYLAAQRLVLPETFGDDKVLLTQGNAVIEGATRLANLAGPAVAGVLISLVGALNVLWLDAATFAVSFAILLIGLARPDSSMAHAAAEGTTGVLAGARHVVGSPQLLRVSAAALLFGLFFPMLLAALPVLAVLRWESDANVAGMLFASWGAGALIGTFAAMRLAASVPPMRLGALSAVALALPLWLLGLDLTAWQFAVVLLVSGLFTPMLNAPLMTVLLTKCPEHVRAQAITFVTTTNLLAGPLGYTVAGPVIELWSMTTLLLVAAAGVSTAALLMLTLVNTDEGQLGETAEATA